MTDPVGMAVAALVAAVARLAVTSKLGGALGEALGSTAAGESERQVTRWFGGKNREQAIERALDGAAAAVNRAHDNFVTSAGGFGSHFAEAGVVADELAKVFTVADRPDPNAIARHWLSWLPSQAAGPHEETMRLMAGVHPAAETLVAEWQRRILAEPAFSKGNYARVRGQSAENLERLVRERGATAAGGGHRFAYLMRVAEEHRHLDTSGTGLVHAHAQVDLGQVYVELWLAPEQRVDERAQIELDRALALLEEADGSRELSAEEYEERVDEIVRGARNASDGVAMGPTGFAHLVGDVDQLMVLGDAGAGKTTSVRWLVYRHALAMAVGQHEVALGDSHVEVEANIRVPVRSRSPAIAIPPALCDRGRRRRWVSWVTPTRRATRSSRSPAMAARDALCGRGRRRRWVNLASCTRHTRTTALGRPAPRRWSRSSSGGGAGKRRPSGKGPLRGRPTSGQSSARRVG